MERFSWVSPRDIPEQFDLRRKGWELLPLKSPQSDNVVLVDANSLNDQRFLQFITMASAENRRMMLVCGAETPEVRSRLLSGGFGDAVAHTVAMEELEARASKLDALANWVPQRRTLADLEMDLLHREVQFAGRAINLHPREFALLWRLADTPDETVSRETLVREVWRLGFIPESNSVAVHISRLRNKLAIAGLKNLVETTATGYRLQRSVLEPTRPHSWHHRQQDSMASDAKVSSKTPCMARNLALAAPA